MVLAEEPDIELVGEASDGAEAVEKAGEALPDVVLMDIRMPKSSGIEACRAMKEVAPSAKIVIADDQRRGGGPLRGDQGGRQRLPAQGHPLRRGRRRGPGGPRRAVPHQPSMAAKLLTEFAALAKRDGEERAQQVPAPKLTDREMEVLRLVARG